MSTIVDSQLSTFASRTKGLQKYNPFLPPQPISIGVPVGYTKRQVTSQDAQAFGSEINFQLSKVDFITDIYAVVTVTMNSSVAPAPSAAMAAISQVRLRSSNGDIAYFSYKPVMRHLGTRLGNEWWSTALKIAGDYSPGAATSVTGCAVIPMPWSTLTTGINNFPPLPTFLYDGSLQLTLTTASAADLQTSDTATAINVSLITTGFQTIASLRQDLLALPSYGWFGRDFQTITNSPLTTTVSDIDISRFTGVLSSLSLVPQLDSTNAPGTSNWWLLTDLTSIQVQIGSDNIYQTYSGSVNEPKMDTFVLGGADGYSYCSQVEGATDLGEVWTLSLSGQDESMAVYASGVVLSEITQSILSVSSVSASSHTDVIGELIAFFNIQNRSIQRFL